jgi:iron complex outermembrane recepter protein
MRISTSDGKSPRLALLATLLPALCGVAEAQTEPAAASAESQSSAERLSSTLETIIVSGTRRDSDVQDVPVTISVVGANEIQTAGINNPSDIEYVVPAVTFNPQIGAGFLIRGLGSQSFEYNLEKAVGVVVDDVVQGLPRSIGLSTLTDVERIEVLKGPQGTLFGKNATAGVIYVVTRKPQLDEFGAQGSLRYGTDNETVIEANVNLPISSTTATRLSAAYQQRDGYLPNRFNGIDGGAYQDVALRAKFLWQPTSDLELYLIGEFQDHEDEGTNVLETITRWPTPATPIPPNSTSLLDFGQLLGQRYGIEFGPDNREYADNDPTTQTIRQKSAQGTLTWRLGDYTLTSITAYKEQDSGNRTDGDKTPTDFNKYNVGELEGKQFTQEVRLNSPVGGFVDYVVGGFYYDQDVSARENQGGLRGRTDLPPNTYVGTDGGTQNYTSRSQSLAAFGQANLHFTDWLTLVAGGRYTDDEVGGSYYYSTDPRFNFVGPHPADISREATASDFSYKAALQIQASDEVMFYGGYAQGYKAPAIGTSAGAARAVLPETVDSYEVGMKSQFFDRRLTLNLALFKQNFNNMQTTTIVFQPDGNFITVLDNAKGVESKGAELETVVRVTDDLSLNGRYAYNPVEFEEFLTTCYRGQVVNPAPGPGCYRPTPTSGTVNDVTGLPSVNAPRNTFNVGFSYSPQISASLQGFANFIYSHRSEAWSVAGDPNTILPSYGLLSGNIGIGTLDGKIRYSIYGRNILDEQFPIRIRSLSFSGAGSYRTTFSRDSERTIGIRMDYAF